MTNIISVNILKVDNVFHLVLLKHTATSLYRSACCVLPTFSDEKLRFCFSALLRTGVNASVLKAEEEL